jgi:hypothetical protein
MVNVAQAIADKALGPYFYILTLTKESYISTIGQGDTCCWSVVVDDEPRATLSISSGFPLFVPGLFSLPYSGPGPVLSFTSFIFSSFKHMWYTTS